MLFAFLANSLAAQTCINSKLSKKFIYELSAEHIKHPSSMTDSANVLLVIREKISGRIHQKIKFGANYLYEDTFNNCDNSRSYVTGYNKQKEVPDYDYGDLIIADLNFDGKEDFAIKMDSGGNGGPNYNFYVQDANGYFGLDNYLNTYVGSFPKYINLKNKTVTTQIHANVHQEGKKTFKYNNRTKKWKLVRWVMVDY